MSGLKRIFYGSRAYRTFHSGYYKFVFGRGVPLGSVLGGIVRVFERNQEAKDIPIPKESWEAQYADGRWDYMNGLAQLARYSVIAGYLQSFRKGGAILDVGCGEGILQQKVGPGTYARYVGIDISSTAIEKARVRRDERTEFVAGDASAYDPGERFDAIVFNESLYYFDDPKRVLTHYERYLKPGGVFVVSLYDVSARARSILHTLRKSCRSIDEVTTRNGADSWTCIVLEPRGNVGGDGAVR